MTVPPTSYFYPQFHFVPNPDAINLESFPDSYAFQFGYTCSGLEGWVQNNNRCKQALYCGVHKNRTQWPMGTLKAFPAADELKETSSVTKSIPKVIHQFSFQPVGSKPERWMRTWYEDFVAENGSEWSYKVWTLEDLKSGSYFCANMYHNDRPMDAVALQLLAMEILYEHGGYYVPLSVLYHSQTGMYDLESKATIVPILIVFSHLYSQKVGRPAVSSPAKLPLSKEDVSSARLPKEINAWIVSRPFTTEKM